MLNVFQVIRCSVWTHKRLPFWTSCVLMLPKSNETEGMYYLHVCCHWLNANQFLSLIGLAALHARSVENVFDQRKISSCMCVSILGSARLCVCSVAEHLEASRIWHGICVFIRVSAPLSSSPFLSNYTEIDIYDKCLPFLYFDETFFIYLSQ